MQDRALTARVEEDPKGDQEILVRSPAVGVLDRVPPQGAYVDPSQSRLILRILGRPHPVSLPGEVQGWVVERLVEEPFSAVEYDQPLFRVSRAKAPRPDHSASGASAAEAVAGGEEGLVPVRAPSHGVFYRRRDPQSPPYVEEGSEVSEGTVLGLVEIMKCFHQIAYEGSGLPKKGTVARILVEDASEVEFEQPLFLIRPSD